MTKGRMKSRAVKRRPNPLTLRVAKPKNSFSFDGSNLHGTIYVAATVTAASNSTDFQMIGTDSGTAPCRVLNSMIRQYREYRYHKVTVQWIPSVGPAATDAGARVHMAYIDNPEQGSTFFNGTAPHNTAALRTAFIKGSRNVFTFNGWERVTWNVPLTRRKPWFDVNTIDAGNDVNMFDRAVQGMVVQAYETVTAAIILGTWKVTFDIEVRGLNADVGAIV